MIFLPRLRWDTNVAPEGRSGLLVVFPTVPETPPSSEMTVDGDATMNLGSTLVIGSQSESSLGTGSSGFPGVVSSIRKMGLISKRVPRNDQIWNLYPEEPLSRGTIVKLTRRLRLPDGKLDGIWNGFVSARRARSTATGPGRKCEAAIPITRSQT